MKLHEITNSINRLRGLGIIDNPYGSRFTYTNAETGVTREIEKATAKAFAEHSSRVFLTARAEARLKSVSVSAEIFPGTTAALASL